MHIYSYIGVCATGMHVDYIHISRHNSLCVVSIYGVATISRLLKTIGLFCRIESVLQGSFAKQTYHFKEPTNRSHPIAHTARTSILLPDYTDMCAMGWLHVVASFKL